jgi:thiol-disulfide isomerase/thioredoxin
MRRLAAIGLALLLGVFTALAQVDTAAVARALGMVDGYVAALEPEDLDTKVAECDFLVSTCVDSLLRQAVATRLYAHYADSQLMGDEAVAIHLYDRWFADGTVAFPTEAERFQARLFAEFNRSSLTGLPAPVLEMRGFEDEPVTVPAPDGQRRSVLYFYDTDCAKCKLEAILLRSWLEDQEADLDLYAVYVGSDRDAWRSYVAERLQFTSSHIRVRHAWDPEVSSDFQRLYGILQTPRLFLLDRTGVITGRRLTVDALMQLVEMGTMDEELFNRNPVGARLPAIRVEGILRKACGASAVRTRDLSRLKGRPAYLVFYSESCSRCQEELPALEASLKRGGKAFLVNVDEILAERPELARQLFDAFDLSLLPHIIAVDAKGRITERYCSFGK